MKSSTMNFTKIKYPIEAFALAMIVFTKTFQEALLSGIIILFITTLCLVIDDFFLIKLPDWSRRTSITLLTTSLSYAVFALVFKEIMGIDLTIDHTIIYLSLGALIAIHILQEKDDSDYNSLLLESSSAYGAMLIMGLLREFLALGQFNGVEIADLPFMSTAFQKIAIGLLFAGIAVAILNKIFGYYSMRLSSFYVLIPIILIEQPFLINSLGERFAVLLSILVTILLLISIKMHISFSWISKEWKGLPIGMVSMSFIYLILTTIM